MYDPQPKSEIGRSVGLGIISTLCGEVSILVISVFVPGLSELYMYVWMDYDAGMGPYRPKMTVTFTYDPRPMSDQRSDKKAIPGIYGFFLRPKLEPDILSCQFLSSVLSHATNTPSTR